MKQKPNDLWREKVIAASEKFRRGVERKGKRFRITRQDTERVANRLLDYTIKLAEKRFTKPTRR